MKSISDLKNQFNAIKAKRASRAEKVPLARELLAGIGEIEKSAFDFSAGVSIAEIRAAREFQAVVEAYLK